MADESTGDPVRDAIIAQGKARLSALSQRVAESEQQPLDENEFNHKWLTPEEALDDLRGRFVDPYTRKKYVLDRLKSGLFIAAARTIESRGQHFEFGGVHGPVFKRLGEYGDDHFWETGDLSFDVDGFTISLFDIRLDPESFSGRPPKAKVPNALGVAAITALPSTEPEKPQLSTADAERFCRAVLAGWGHEVKQDWAHEKAMLFFPDKKVPRDWFRSILRSIRGPTKRGKKPKTAE